MCSRTPTKLGPNDGSAHIAWCRSIAPYLSGLQAEYFEQASSNKALFDTNPCCWTGPLPQPSRAGRGRPGCRRGLFRRDEGERRRDREDDVREGVVPACLGRLRGRLLLAVERRQRPLEPCLDDRHRHSQAPRYQVGVGRRRQYSGGTALVNPHYATAQTFNLGANYLTPSGTTVTSVTLPPITAMVLRSTQTAPFPNAAPLNTSLPVISGTAMGGSV